MRNTLIAIALVACTLLCGCASLTGGRYYNYEYTTKVDGTKSCKLTIDSGSMLQGATLDVCNPDGHATAGAAGVAQGESRIDFSTLVPAIGAVVQQSIRGQPIVVPAPAATTTTTTVTTPPVVSDKPAGQ